MPPSSPPRPITSQPDGVDASPLLSHSVADHLLRSRRFLRRPVPPFRGTAARLLRHASGRQMSLREPSMQVRENAAEQLETRQSNWAYSKPIVVLDMLWNVGILCVSCIVLILSLDERPEEPLRLWITGYMFQCLFHMVCVVVEYMRRQREMDYVGSDASGGWGSGDLSPYLNSGSGSGSDEGDSEDYVTVQHHDDEQSSITKHLESANSMFAFVWWIIGFYWVDAGGDDLGQEAPQLYWLCITFLVLDVVFVVACVAAACVVGILVCFCLPCIIAILYALTDQEGASQEDIDRLAKYKFHRLGDYEKMNGDTQLPFGGIMIECGTDTPTEQSLSKEDAECCICLCPYEDGSELRELPCRHHFHSACIGKWLGINAVCPLCKFNILKSQNDCSSEIV